MLCQIKLEFLVFCAFCTGHQTRLCNTNQTQVRKLIMEFDDEVQGGEAVKCSQHPEEEAVLFCNHCQQVACFRCVLDCGNSKHCTQGIRKPSDGFTAKLQHVEAVLQTTSGILDSAKQCQANDRLFNCTTKSFETFETTNH